MPQTQRLDRISAHVSGLLAHPFNTSLLHGCEAAAAQDNGGARNHAFRCRRSIRSRSCRKISPLTESPASTGTVCAPSLYGQHAFPAVTTLRVCSMSPKGGIQTQELGTVVTQPCRSLAAARSGSGCRVLSGQARRRKSNPRRCLVAEAAPPTGLCGSRGRSLPGGPPTGGAQTRPATFRPHSGLVWCLL
jgi:hypothetical protein